MIQDHTDTDILIIHATSWFHAAVFSDLIPTAYLEIHTHHSLKASNGLRTRIQSFSLLWGCSDCRGSCKIVPDCQVSCWSSNFVSYTVFSEKELGDPKPVTFPETRTPKMSITKGRLLQCLSQLASTPAGWSQPPWTGSSSSQFFLARSLPRIGFRRVGHRCWQFSAGLRDLCMVCVYISW